MIRTNVLKLASAPRALRAFLFSCFLAVASATTASAGNPVPYISEITPLSAMPGGATFTLTVRGTGFATGSVVNWIAGTATTPLATAVITPTQLAATVPASLITTTGTFTVIVSNPSTSVPSNPVFFDVTAPLASLPLSAYNIKLGRAGNGFIRPVVVGDFNGDGILDLASANPGASYVSILLGNGDGTFAAAPDVTTTAVPNSLALADFNGDGKSDMAVTGYNRGIVTVSLGHGDGTFASPTQLLLGGGPDFVAAADFNGDGRMDLAVARIDGSTGEIVVLTGHGDGTFATPGLFIPLGPGAQPTSIAVGDFNGDGHLDMAVTDVINSEVHILLGHGATFSYGQIIPTQHNPGPAALGDFNGDGKLDMVVGGLYENSASVFLGNGDGTFTLANTFATDSPYGITAGNFDGDQNLDIAVAHLFDETVTIWHGNGDGTFTEGTAAPTSKWPSFIATGDFNRDGALDLVVGNQAFGQITVALQQLPESH